MILCTSHCHFLKTAEKRFEVIIETHTLWIGSCRQTSSSRPTSAVVSLFLPLQLSSGAKCFWFLNKDSNKRRRCPINLKFSWPSLILKIALWERFSVRLKYIFGREKNKWNLLLFAQYPFFVCVFFNFTSP